ncbi:nucleoside deaminase [Kaistella flava (ex Peng et al. 2021)]|uniref:Nucleoside deaminase n=1 Tax=Kaistella flava (ex Peng et al. 2021) TaxID=2038776 RepID=A0A7M2Y8D1_9FLAO|nr:nucleoside deaminase [Kaistella flava (ex Peng et al. 2021)]QOW09593.1 nucleoside deaminase [Kaistella flava (ex Peng et al. 2021)]
MNNTDLQQHESYMRICLDLAKIAKQRGDSPVGSIIVQNGVIIGEGIEGGKTHKDITFHAEIEAIRNATKKIEKQDLSDCIMYTTHEPCIMCSYVIRHTKIPIIVTGIATGEIGGFSSKLPLLLDTTIKKWSTPPILIKGILEKECAALHN